MHVTSHLKAFLQFLRLNRNASAHTVRAYESDLTQFIGYVAAGADLLSLAEAQHSLEDVYLELIDSDVEAAS